MVETATTGTVMCIHYSSNHGMDWTDHCPSPIPAWDKNDYKWN